jgi:8-oxo-dGTP pyrophosphatase MutT (NUDIX family)
MGKLSKYESHVLKPWTVSRSRRTFQDEWLTLRTDDCITPHGRSIDRYHIVEQPDWVNVVALTAQWQVILVRQYRHGTKQICIGLPSGICDAADDSQLHAAKRELIEETRFCSDSWDLLRKFAANPGRQNNSVFGYIALNTRIAETPCTACDANEVIEVLQVPWAEFVSDVISGEVDLQSHHPATVLLAKEFLGNPPESKRFY